MTFEERSNIAIQCLPDAPYKEQLKKLHTEMLNEIKKLKHYKENRTCSGCWGEINKCVCGE